MNFIAIDLIFMTLVVQNRFGESVQKFQSGSVNVQASLSFLNITQQVLLQACLATSLSLAVISIQQRMDCCITSGCDSGNSTCCSNSEVCTGLEIGDFITVLSYTLNLFMPLNFLGSIYNMVGEYRGSYHFLFS